MTLDTPSPDANAASLNLGALPPEQAAEWRTRHYGNEGYVGGSNLDSVVARGVAMGDSWFQYLPARLLHAGDIIDCLVAKHGVAIYRTAIAGDTVENMVWNTGYWESSWKPRLKYQLSDALEAIKTQNPAFFLFSGGGNDIAGTPLGDFVNHQMSGKPPLRRESFNELVNNYLRTAYQDMIVAVKQAKAGLPVIFHGYDYPVPDGRAVINGPFGFHYVGPWLRPVFAQKRIEMESSRQIMIDLIDAFNAMLKGLHNPANHTYYVDLRGELKKLYGGDANGYQAAWANELHASDEGFAAIADLFAPVIHTALGKPIVSVT